MSVADDEAPPTLKLDWREEEGGREKQSVKEVGEAERTWRAGQRQATNFHVAAEDRQEPPITLQTGVRILRSRL